MADHELEATKFERAGLSRHEAYQERVLAEMEEEKKDAPLRDEVRAIRTNYFAERLAEITKNISNERELLESAQALARHADNIGVTLTTSDNERRTAKGGASELAEYLQGQQFKFAEIVAPGGRIRGHSIVLSLDSVSGLKLSVDSSDPNWARAAYLQLLEEIEKNVPKYLFLRTYAFLSSLFLICFMAFGAFLYAAFDSAATSEASRAATIFVFWVLAVAAAAVTTSKVRKKLPAFEILALGQRPSATTLWLSISAPIVTVGLGILVNVISARFV